MNFTNEQIAKAKQAKTVEELLAIAKENGFELTEEQAKKYFAELNKQGELSDEELEAVAGGSKWSIIGTSSFESECPFCGKVMTIDIITYVNSSGDSYDELTEYYCSCGAELEHSGGSAVFAYTRDGEKRYGYTWKFLGYK